MDGFAPVLGSASGLSISPCPGVTLNWDAATGVVTASMPDGSSLLAAPYTTAFVPRGVTPPPLQTLATPPELPAPSGKAGATPPALPPAVLAAAAAALLDDLAANPELSGTFLFDLQVSVSICYRTQVCTRTASSNLLLGCSTTPSVIAGQVEQHSC